MADWQTRFYSAVERFSIRVQDLADAINEFNKPEEKMTTSKDHPFVVEAERRFTRTSDGVVWLSTDDLREIISDVGYDA